MLRTSRSLSRASTGLRSNQRISRPWRLQRRMQVLDGQREPALADAVRGALEVGKVVARHLLVGADEQMRELPAAGAGLREQLRDRRLQHVLGKEERRLERHLRRTAARGRRRGQLEVGALVEEPLRVALEHLGQKLEHFRARASACRSRSCSGRKPTARARASRWMQRAESSSSVSPLRLRIERSLAPRKCPLRSSRVIGIGASGGGLV